MYNYDINYPIIHDGQIINPHNPATDMIRYIAIGISDCAYVALRTVATKEKLWQQIDDVLVLSGTGFITNWIANGLTASTSIGAFGRATACIVAPLIGLFTILIAVAEGDISTVMTWLKEFTFLQTLFLGFILNGIAAGLSPKID